MVSGVRVSLRPMSGSTLATASAAARARPRMGNTPASGERTKPATPTITPSATGAASFFINSPRPSRRQLSKGPTSRMSTNKNVSGTLALLK